MSTTTRDIHSPANVHPEDYSYFTAFYQGPSEDMHEAYALENDLFYATYNSEGGYGGNFDTKGTCDHCGARFAHGVAYRHAPTDALVMVGHICASETFNEADRAALVRKRAERLAEVIKRVREAREALSDEARAAVDFFAEDDGGLRGDYALFIGDLCSKARRYPLSDKQQAALIKAHASVLERRAERAKNVKARVEPPEGRVEFTGTIVSTKWYDSEFGSYQGMTIVVSVGDDGEYVVWSRVPKALVDPVRGDTVTLRARLDRKDVGFAIAGRPYLIEHVEVES